MKNLLPVVAATLFLALAGWGKGEPPKPELPPASSAVDFAKDIRPLLAARCVSCHGEKKQSSGLRLDSRAEALKGGNSGPVIVAGKSEASRLIHVVAGMDQDVRMPPKGASLTPDEIGKLRAWIDRGADWSGEIRILAQGSEPSRHWSLVAPRRPSMPRTTQRDWARNELDLFILARLEAEGIAASVEADPVILIRRLSLDLRGLPPTPEEVDEFLRDPAPGAYERVVDRFLASPHYGERWGRHWLDSARYADSDGFEKDTGRPHAWRYRDWVIQALNRDLPFDQFTIEQIAGDLLPGATLDQKVATGFHRNTLTNKEGGVDPEQFRVEQVVDRVNTTAKVFLGLTLGCCQCHDHKYDPFSQREYYQLFAFFNSDREVDIPAPLPGELEPYERKKAAFDQKRAELAAAVEAYKKEKLPAAEARWEAGLKLADLRKLPGPVQAALLVDPTVRSDKQKKELSDYYAKTDTELAKLNKRLADHAKTSPTISQAQTLALGPERKTTVMIRGDFLRPGVAVEADTPALLPPLETSSEKATRLDLARWLVDPANPLTPRVITNWIWHKYFGRGLVATLEDFGTQGEKPSHPELLDWLADEFVRQGWSMKAMHRLIVTSATYRQSSRVRPELAARDPLNILLARQHRLRLEGEIVRDAALFAGGLLNRRIGGPSVRPPQPPGISELTYANSARWVESTGPDRYRRGMYTWFQRTSPYPMLMTFDSPDSNVCCVRRDRSNTPLQALTLLNDTVFVECAQSLGRRLHREATGNTVDRIRRGFRLCLAREPTAEEQAALSRLFQQFRELARARSDQAARLAGQEAPAGEDAAAWVALARVLLNLDEFVVRD